MPEVGWLKIVDYNGKAVWTADQTQSFCMRSHKYTDNLCPECDHKKTKKECAREGVKFESTGTRLKRYMYFAYDNFAENELYVDRHEHLLNYDRRH